MKTASEVRLNGERTSQTAFQTRSNHQNKVVGWLRMDGYSPGSEMLVHSPQILSYLGNVGLELFHASGVSLETNCSYERTPMFIAVDFGSDKTFCYLMENGAQVYAVNSVGSTALVRAISHCRFDRVNP